MYLASHSYLMTIDKPTVVLKHFFGSSLNELCLKHSQSFQLLLMSKFRILRNPKYHLVTLYRVSPLWRQGFNRDNQMYMSSQVKSTLRKLRDWEKGRIVTVYYSCHMYPYCTSLLLHIWLNGPLYLLNVSALTRYRRLQITDGKMLNHVSSICLGETFLLMKLNCLSSSKKSINQM